MQVFGRPGHIIRSGKLSSRIAAKSQDNEAEIRRAAVVRWRQAMADGPRRLICSDPGQHLYNSGVKW